MSAFTTRWGWRDIPANATPEQVRTLINERMRRLEDILNRWADDLESGPIPGAYYPVQLSYTESGGLTTGIKDSVPISFDATVRAVYAYINGAGANQVTIDINNGATSILAAPLVVDDTEVLNASSDFAVSSITPPSINLEIDSVDVGAPVHIRVVVILQNVTRVEDQ